MKKNKRPKHSPKTLPPSPKPVGQVSVAETVAMFENMAKRRPFARDIIVAHLNRLRVSLIDVKVSSTDLDWIEVLRKILEQREQPQSVVSNSLKGKQPLFGIPDSPKSSKRERSAQIKKDSHLLKSFGLNILAGINQLPSKGEWKLLELAQRFRVPVHALRVGLYRVDENLRFLENEAFVSKEELTKLRSIVRTITQQDQAKDKDVGKNGDKRSLYEKITSRGRRMFIPTWMRD